MAFGRSEQESHCDYSAAEVALIEEFARRASVAVENARLFRKADELNRLKDEFLAALGHELRNPLAAIQYALQTLQLQPDKDPTQADAHDTLDRQVAQLSRLVDDLLNVSRITSGRIRLKLESLDLRSVVHRALEVSRTQAEAKGIRLTELSDPETLWVEADAARLEQVFVNLVDNALKYTDRGSVSLSCTREAEVISIAVSAVTYLSRLPSSSRLSARAAVSAFKG